MNKYVKWLGWVVGGVVGLLLAVLIILKLIPNGTYEGWITEGVKNATGRDLAFEEFDLDFGTRVGLNATGITFSNAEWGTRPQLFSADQVDVRLRLIPLLWGVVDFSFLMDRPDILMETNDEGVGNWVFDTSAETAGADIAEAETPEEISVEEPADPEQGTPSLPIKPYIRNLAINGLTFAYNDRVLVSEMDAAIDVLSLAVEEDELVLELDADYQDITIILGGTLGDVEDMYEFTFAPLQLNANINDSVMVSVAGTAGPLMPSSELKLDLDIAGELDSLASLEPFMALGGQTGEGAEEETEEESAPLPDSGPWTMNVKAVAEGGWPGPVSVNANLGVDEITASADAIVSVDGGEMSANLDIALDAPSTTALGAALGQEVPDRAPFTVRTALSAQPARYALDEMNIQLGEGTITGSAAFEMPADDVPFISARLDLTDVDLTPLPPKEPVEGEGLQVEDESAEGHVAKEEAPKTGARLFSDEPFGTGPLRSVNADARISATNLIYQQGAIPTAEMNLKLEDGMLNIDPLHVEGSGRGALDGRIQIDATQREFSNLDIFIDGNDFATPGGGSLDLDIDIDGQGNSVASLLGGLDGQFVFALTDLEIKDSFLSRLGTGLGNLNPFASQDTTLECAVIRMDIVDGQVDFEDKIVAMLTDSTIMGSGTVNLKTEELDAGVNIEPRKVAGSIVDLGLSGLVSVSGTLAEPSVRLNAADVAKKYASYSAYIATGGLSWLVEKAVGQVKANADVCGNVLQDGAEDSTTEG